MSPVKPKTTKPKKSAVKAIKKKVSGKKATKAAATAFGHYAVLIAEAITVSATEEKQWVSYAKIKQYLIDYMEGGQPAQIPKRGKSAILGLVGLKFLKAKKDSYAFTTAGRRKLAPSKVEKRGRIDRPAKAAPPAPKPEPRREYIMMTGRTSRSLA